MFSRKKYSYQKLVIVFLISILASNSLVVYATDLFDQPENSINMNVEEELTTNSSVIQTEETTMNSSEMMNNETSSMMQENVEKDIFEETTDQTIEALSETAEEAVFDPYFPLEPTEEDLKGDLIKPGEIAPPVDTNNLKSRISKMNQEIINNANKGTFKRAKIKTDWREYSMFPYQALNGGTQNKPHGIVIHETANPNSTIEGEISYMDRNWRNAFVHAFVDQSQIIEIHNPSYGGWGAGREANKYFMHIELVEHPNNRTAFMKSVLNDAYYAATKLAQFDLEPSRPTKKKGDISGTIWSHHEVSTYLGGTNHSDPTGYFSKFGYSMEQFYELIQYEYENLSVILPDGKEVKKTGWHKLKTGTWSFVEKKRLAKGWLQVEGKSYYFDSEGIMQQGWNKQGNTWYHLLPDGAASKGWTVIGGKWYYFNQSGVMQQGWSKQENTWYYLLPSGEMAQGWVSAGGKWYYFNQSGAMQQGWSKQGNTWYYLLPDGEMVTGWAVVGWKWYYFNSSGAMQQGWSNQSGTKYYLLPSGEMAQGWKEIGSVWYYFNEKGVNIDTTQANFISQNISDVLTITKKHKLYPSIMLAQASLESGYGTSELAKNANNFFGMKFKVDEDEEKYDIYYVDTKEYDKENDETIIINAPFRMYENKRRSFEDNAMKLRLGVSWNPTYYEGAWRENSKDYKEVSQALVGKYATDKEYANKLNSVIERWNLHQFD